MEIYRKRELTPEEKGEDIHLKYYGTNETKLKLLNSIKEVLELTNFTSIDKLTPKTRHQVNNKLTEKEIVNISLYTFLELIVNPDSILFLMAVNPEEIEELKLGNIKTVTSNLINCSIDVLTDFSEESIISSVKQVLKANELEEKKIRKAFLESKKLEIEKELASLEGAVEEIEVESN